MLGQSILRNSLILLVFACVTAGGLAGTYQLTEARIAEAQRRAAQAALYDILPPSQFDNDLLEDTVTLGDVRAARLNLKSGTEVHIARRNGIAIAAILPSVASDGYSGDIHLLIGILNDGSLAGVRVLNHKETPGLGDKIDVTKSDWILQFKGLSLGEPPLSRWTVEKNGGAFDQFTGATITPRAVVHQIRDTLTFFSEHRETLIPPAESGAGP